MWKNDHGERFEKLLERLVEALSNRESDPLLTQHISDCVRRQDKIEATLRDQSTATAAMHKENQLARERDNKAATARFVSLLLAMVGSLLAPWAVQLFHGLH